MAHPYKHAAKRSHTAKLRSYQDGGEVADAAPPPAQETATIAPPAPAYTPEDEARLKPIWGPRTNLAYGSLSAEDKAKVNAIKQDHAAALRKQLGLSQKRGGRV